jgi:hypothetical protein
MQEAKTLVHRWYHELWNNQNDKIIDEMADPNVEVHGLGETPIKGLRVFANFIMPLKANSMISMW